MFESTDTENIEKGEFFFWTKSNFYCQRSVSLVVITRERFYKRNNLVALRNDCFEKEEKKEERKNKNKKKRRKTLLNVKS